MNWKQKEQYVKEMKTANMNNKALLSKTDGLLTEIPFFACVAVYYYRLLSACDIYFKMR